jgi:hypothetical protein
MTRINQLRRAALEAGMVPVGVLVPRRDIDHTMVSGAVFGMKIDVMTDRLEVLAMPNRRIGKYECVAPTRFTEAL